MSHKPQAGPNDACPCCWHGVDSRGATGIGTYSIEDLITHVGGMLDEHGTCDKCQWNVILTRNCTNCTKTQPCSKHYATVHDGTMSEHMPRIVHNLYMRNSPYKRSWTQRPASVEEWYAHQASTTSEAISLLRRFTSDYKVHSELNALERNVSICATTFWHELHLLSTSFFSSGDAISIAFNTFCQTLWSITHKNIILISFTEYS